ncbi:MAG: hypothetical protein ACPGQL_06040 [Thermoplasmatota archaeon]
MHAPLDLDYVESFQTLASVNLELEKLGNSPERLLRKAVLELAVGNFQAGLRAAQQAIVGRHDNSEAHYQLGLAQLLLAFVEAEAIPAGPSWKERPSRIGVRSRLQAAADAFADAVRLNADDGDAVAGLEHMGRLLLRDEGEAALAERLRDLSQSRN